MIAYDSSRISASDDDTTDAPAAEGAGAGANALADAPAPPFIALSRFVVANGMTDQVKRAFVGRPHMVDDAPGFLRLEVISPIDTPDEIWLLTYWRDESSYRVWHKGHTYRDAHAGIPKGLRLDPRGTSLRFFEHICS